MGCNGNWGRVELKKALQFSVPLLSKLSNSYMVHTTSNKQNQGLFKDFSRTKTSFQGLSFFTKSTFLVSLFFNT